MRGGRGTYPCFLPAGVRSNLGFGLQSGPEVSNRMSGSIFFAFLGSCVRYLGMTHHPYVQQNKRSTMAAPYGAARRRGPINQFIIVEGYLLIPYHTIPFGFSPPIRTVLNRDCSTRRLIPIKDLRTVSIRRNIPNYTGMPSFAKCGGGRLQLHLDMARGWLSQCPRLASSTQLFRDTRKPRRKAQP